MDNSTPILIKPPDPPPQSQNFDLSPLEFLLALFAVIIIPTLIYTFFLFLKCPPIPFRHRRQTSSDSSSFSAAEENQLTGRTTTEVVTDVKYNKEVHVKGVGGGECPVCLSAFVDGEQVRQLTVCKHYFHASCIDMWLHSHSSCPVCRASVAVKGSDRSTTTSVVAAGESDFRQGLPDSTSLV